MRFIFKTDYAQDIRLFQHGGQVFWYGLLLLLMLLMPFLVSGYVLSQLHFICIYSIVGLGLMLLVGYTGQISLGHAAFLATGAYTEALLQGAGVPFVISDRKSTRLNSSHANISYAVFCLKKKKD